MDLNSALNARLEALAAAPKPWLAVTIYDGDRADRVLPCLNEKAARNHADSEARKIGRELIDRDTGAKVRVVAVDVRPAPRADLAAMYVKQIGYDPFEDDPTISEREVAEIIAYCVRKDFRP